MLDEGPDRPLPGLTFGRGVRIGIGAQRSGSSWTYDAGMAQNAKA